MAFGRVRLPDWVASPDLALRVREPGTRERALPCNSLSHEGASCRMRPHSRKRVMNEIELKPVREKMKISARAVLRISESRRDG